MAVRTQQQTSQTPHTRTARDVTSMGPGQMETTFQGATERSDGSLLHPASGLVILGFDWMLFPGSVVSAGVLMPLMCMLGFLIGGAVVALVQYHRSSDDFGKALTKGVVSGLLVGIPTPIVGTTAGLGVMAISGLHRLLRR